MTGQGLGIATLISLLAVPLGALAQPHGIAFGGAARFFPTESVAATPPPSFVIEYPPRGTKPIPSDFGAVPEYSTVEGLTVAAVPFPEGASIYGLGAEAGGLIRSGKTPGPAACPWIMAVGPDGASVGVLADTTFECRVDLDSRIRVSSADPKLPVIVLKASTPLELLIELNELTGRMEMPPQWALGYHQAAPKGEAEVLATAKWLRDSGIAADSVWTIGQARLDVKAEEPPKLISDLRELGLRLVSPLSPWVAQRPGDALYDQGTAGEHWVLLESGTPMIHRPGEESFVLPDFTREATRSWWSRAVGRARGTGFAGFLAPRGADMMLTPEASLRGDPNLGGRGLAAQYQSVLPTLAARSIAAGAGGEKTPVRPFVVADRPRLTLQRSAALVLPASGKDWEALHAVLRAALSSTLSGHPLVGAEIPDFGGADPMLARRWVGLAATLPLVKGSFAAAPDNPMLNEEFKKTLAAAMQRRSSLIPYYYTLCFSAFFRCEPIIRPLFWADPTEPSLRGRDDAFLLGPDLLIVPRLTATGEEPPCPLKGGWRKLDLGAGGNPELPSIYLRPGAILPLGPATRDTGEHALDPLTILVNLDQNGTATGIIYEDEGDGYAFYRNGCRRAGYSAERREGSVFIRLSQLDGGLPLPKRKWEIRVLTDAGEVTGTGSEKGTVKIDLPPQPLPTP